MFSKNTLASFTDLDEVLDQTVNLSTYARLAKAGLGTRTINEEISKYPCSDDILKAMEMAGLLSVANRQLVVDLLFACKTISTRQAKRRTQPDHNEETVADEFKRLSALTMKLANNQLLSARVCSELFGDVTSGDMLGKLEKTLSLLEPLTEKKINTVLADTGCYHTNIHKCLSVFDKSNICYPYLLEHVDVKDIPVIKSCLNYCLHTGYYRWITPALFISATKNPQAIDTIFSSYDALHKIGKLTEYQQLVIDKPDFAKSMKLLREAKQLSADSASLALANPDLGNAINVLMKFNLINDHKSYNPDWFHSAIVDRITGWLLKTPETCQILMKCDELHTKDNNAICSDDIRNILYAKIPATENIFKNLPELLTAPVLVRMSEIEEMLSAMQASSLKR